MMSWNKKLLLIIAACLSFILQINAEELPADIKKGFSNGDAALISGYFKNTIELSINNTENIYSSTQAELILKAFFKNNSPISFNIIHEGGQSESKYAIGTLETVQGTYRVTLLIKTSNNKQYIHQLRIDKDGV